MPPLSAMGGFSKPLESPPSITGLESFKGEKFHSARWRHDVDLKGKRVALIGSGCSACQILPALAPDRSINLLNFVRSPPWMVPKDQYKYKGWQKKAFRYIPGLMWLYRLFLFFSSDILFFMFRNVWLVRLIRSHIIEKRFKDYIRSQAPKEYADFLIPKYPFGCKRLILDGGYLKSLHQENVKLITDPIEKVTEKGILGKSGQEYEVDVIVLATGFDLTERGIGLPLQSKDGRELTDVWREKKGPQAYLGTTISGFPNCYILLGPNVATGHSSAIFQIECQINYVVKMIEPMVKYGVKAFDVKPETEEKYNSNLHRDLKDTVWAASSCDSFYRIGNKVIVIWPSSASFFWWRTFTPDFRNYQQKGGVRKMAGQSQARSVFFSSLSTLAVAALAASGVSKAVSGVSAYRSK